MNPIRVAIVGCGRISGLHELGYRGREDACIVAVCDTKRKNVRSTAKAWNVDKVYTDYEKLLADPEIDLVELLVPHHLHAEMTVAACRAGKHVSVQKPMALTVAEGVEWHDSFIACTRHLIDVLRDGGQPVLDGPTGKAVLQFTLAVHISACTGREIWPDEVRN